MNNRKESIFPVDSFPGRRSIFRVVYPENTNVEYIKRVMIDLDGTIHKYSKGYADGTIYDEAFEGARKVIDFLRNLGYEIVIFTTRALQTENDNYEEQIKNISQWLQKNGIYFDKITAEKLAADFYIDDKAIRINNGDWDTVLYTIKKILKFR